MTTTADPRLETQPVLTHPVTGERPRVVVAGGGVAAVEAVLALRAQHRGQIGIDLVAPEAQFVYQPTSVAEPFGMGHARRFRLRGFARGRAELHRDRIASVDGIGKEVVLDSGARLAYDALLLAPGARRAAWLEGAVHFAGSDGIEDMRRLLAEIESGDVSRVAFVVPPATSWTLPLYELAVLTSAWAADRHVNGLEISVVTPEETPLAVFGPSAGRAVRDLLADRGIELRPLRGVESFEWGTLALRPDGAVKADRLVTMPRLYGPAIPGVPANGEGFIIVDDHGAVAGLDGVYAAGDGTTFPVKQGGLAAQEADAAAAAIGARLTGTPPPKPFKPVLRGVLLTGVTPTYLRSPLAAQGDPNEVSAHPLWWPPSKIAGRHLAPFLAGHDARAGDGLEDRHPEADPPRSVEDQNAELRDLALAMAEDDARAGDFASALEWLAVIEQMYGLLSPEDAELRERWSQHVPDAV